MGLDPATGEKRSAAEFSVEYPGPGGQRPRLALAKRRPRHELERVIKQSSF